MKQDIEESCDIIMKVLPNIKKRSKQLIENNDKLKQENNKLKQENNKLKQENNELKVNIEQNCTSIIRIVSNIQTKMKD